MLTDYQPVDLATTYRANTPLEASILAAPALHEWYRKSADNLKLMRRVHDEAPQLCDLEMDSVFRLMMQMSAARVYSSGVRMAAVAIMFSADLGAKLLLKYRHWPPNCTRAVYVTQTVLLFWKGAAGESAELICPFCSRWETSLVRSPVNLSGDGGPKLGEYACRGCAGLAFTVPLPALFEPVKRRGRKSVATQRRIEQQMVRFGERIKQKYSAGV